MRLTERMRDRGRRREREKEGFGEGKACGLQRGGREGGEDEKQLQQVISLCGGPLEFMFIVESTDDPTYRVVSMLLSELKDEVDAKIVVVGIATTCSQKIHNRMQNAVKVLYSDSSVSVNHSEDYLSYHEGSECAACAMMSQLNAQGALRNNVSTALVDHCDVSRMDSLLEPEPSDHASLFSIVKHIRAQDEKMSTIVRALAMSGLQIPMPAPDIAPPSTSQPIPVA
ncbi:hypothetical protein DVH24_035510 [Malus domestica]|uniref:Uncharacterized protein n=1 Tax=Malus domestica TaxID=3750 RepID=A0A498J6D0_MALDO|nr:hypothetical protein DVH24_035510 [Malus domestica]